MRVFICILLVALSATPALAQSGTPDAAGTSVGDPVDQLTGDEQAMLNLLNQARQQHERDPLALDTELTEAARKHSRLMMRQRELSHDFPGEPELLQRLAGANVHFDAAAENVAESGSVSDAHRELMLSPGHRANILSPRYNAVGIGIVTSSDDQIYVTEDFAHRVTKFSPPEIEDGVFAQLNKLRAQKGLAPLERRKISMLEHEACREDINVKAIGRALSSAGWVSFFTSAQPSEIPDAVVKVALLPEARSVGLGVCYPPAWGESYSIFQVVAVFFRRAEE
jgi:uncharacterized protein YkwD